MSDVKEAYRKRFDERELQRKEGIWRILVKHFFQKYVSKDAVVLDVGAGYCEFINNVECKEKHALDINLDMKRKAGYDVECHVKECTDLGCFMAGYFDIVFTSNMFEHMHVRADILSTLKQMHRILKPDGKLLIMQPNMRYVGSAYWDFFDHNIPLSHLSMVDALTESGFEVCELRSRFLPYTTKGYVSVPLFFLYFYLKSGLLQRLFGKQMFIVAKRRLE